jgi:hypothetical protein
MITECHVCGGLISTSMSTPHVCNLRVALDHQDREREEFEARVRREEREACAAIVEGWAEDEPTCCKQAQTAIAAKIRRGGAA